MSAPRGVFAALVSFIGEPTEGSLVMVRGTVDSVRTDSGRLTLTVGDGSIEVRALADPSTGLTRADVSRGDLVELIGIVGQRASATGRADGYRLWLRSRSDLAVLPQSRPPAVGSTPAPSEPAVRHDLASALGDRGSIVDVAALGAARQARLRAGSFVPRLFAAGRRVRHLRRPARPTLGLGMLSRPSWRIRKPSRPEAPDPSGQLADELRKRG